MSDPKRSHIYNDGSEITTQNTDLQINALRHIIKILEILQLLYKTPSTYTENSRFLKSLEEELQVTLAHVYQAVQRKKHGYQNKNTVVPVSFSDLPQSNPITQIDINGDDDDDINFKYGDNDDQIIDNNNISNFNNDQKNSISHISNNLNNNSEQKYNHSMSSKSSFKINYVLSWFYLENFSKYINKHFIQHILFHLLKVILPLFSKQRQTRKRLSQNLCKKFNPKENCLPMLDETVHFLHLEKVYIDIQKMQNQYNLSLNLDDDGNQLLKKNGDQADQKNYIIRKIEQVLNYKNSITRTQKLINLTLNAQIIEIKKFSALIRYLNQFNLKDKMHHNDNDIIQQPPPFWKNLEKKISYSLIFNNMEVLEKQMHHFLHMVSLTVSTCYATRNVKNLIFRQILETFYTAFFKLSRKHSFKQTNKFLGDSDSKTQIQTAIRIWNGMDKIYAIRYFVQTTCFEYIQFHQKLYLPRISEPLSLDQIFKWQDERSFDQQEELQIKEKWDKNIYEKANKIKKIKVRLICGQNLVAKQQNIEQKDSLLTKLTQKINISNFQKSDNKEIETIIIHIHGGGWVSMSSFAHQMYTRKWANYKDLKGIPIFSVDYRKSPRYAYPCALDDCFQAYLFILKEIQNYYNINPKNIILCGDSAGGNMCLGIVQLCLKYNIQLPSYVFLSYPAMNLSAANYTPSINFAFDDLICPFQFMKMCQSLLIQNDKIDPDNDPLISPLVMSNKTIKQLPPIKIAVGENDSLKDDSIRFLKRLQDNGHEQSEILIYTGLKHGYLNWDIPFGIRLARKCIDDSSEAMLQHYKQNILKPIK